MGTGQGHRTRPQDRGHRTSPQDGRRRDGRGAHPNVEGGEVGAKAFDGVVDLDRPLRLAPNLLQPRGEQVRRKRQGRRLRLGASAASAATAASMDVTSSRLQRLAIAAWGGRGLVGVLTLAGVDCESRRDGAAGDFRRVGRRAAIRRLRGAVSCARLLAEEQRGHQVELRLTWQRVGRRREGEGSKGALATN